MFLIVKVGTRNRDTIFPSTYRLMHSIAVRLSVHCFSRQLESERVLDEIATVPIFMLHCYCAASQKERFLINRLTYDLLSYCFSIWPYKVALGTRHQSVTDELTIFLCDQVCMSKHRGPTLYI